VRNKPGYDGAVPSGNSVAALALLRLGKLTMNMAFTDRAKQVLDAFSGQLAESPMSLTAMLTAVDFWLGPSQEIVIAGDLTRDDAKAMLGEVRSRFLPNTVVLFHQSGTSGKAIEKEVPFLLGQIAIDNKATAYVCENYACKMPVDTLEELKALLDEGVKASK